MTELGRFIVATSAGKTRTVTIWNVNSSGSYAEVCSVSNISLTSGLNTYIWSAVSGTPTLTSGIIYLIASNERANDVTNGWAEQTTLTSTAAINNISLAYQGDDVPTYGGWNGSTANAGFAGVNFKYV